MADVTIGNTNLSQNHPRIITLVSNESQTYQSNTSGLTAFAAVISEKGSEKITKVTSAAEFLKLYGSMDIRNFGQSSYNVVNWLSAGGSALVKRVMPDDAAFAHALLNVRTKKTGNNVSIQTLVSSVEAATTEDTLEYVLANAGGANHEGFEDNLIALISPIGRGKAYHNMGFRLYPNKQYDNYINYRLYNFEVIEFTEEGSYNVLEGPFAVSFNRDAISPINNESIFIEDVIAAYSEFIKVQVNDENYLKVCKLICPGATNPFIVDPFFANTRIVGGLVETVGGKDVHHKLFKLDGDGNPVIDSHGEVIKLMANPESEFEVQKIFIEDNEARNAFAYDRDSKIEDMAALLGKIKASTDPEGLSIAAGLGLSATIDDSLDNAQVIRNCRKAIAGGIVTGKTVSALEVALDNFVDEIVEYKIAASRQSTAEGILDDFYDTLISDLKLITSSHSLTKIAWIQDKITSFSRELTNLDLGDVDGLDDLEAIVDELSDEYTTLAAKSAKAEVLLKQDATAEGSLLKLVGDVINTVKGQLQSSVKVAPKPSSELKSAFTALMNDSGNVFNASFKEYERLYQLEKQKALTERVIFAELQDLTVPVRLRDGSDGEFDLENTERAAAIDRYLCQLFEGTLDELIVSSELCQFNFLFDGDYSLNVKNSIADLAQNVRRDFLFIADCGLNASAKADLAFRQQFNVASNFIAIYGQNEIVYDPYGGKDVKVTTPYFMAEKLPTLEATVGLQNPIAGSKRGVVSGFKHINYLPTELEKEDLYNARINYVEGDGNTYRLGSQLTSDVKRTPLSDINNVITMLNIKRDAQNIVKLYQFEYNDDDVMRAMQQDLNLNLNKYVTNNCVDTLDCTVYASEYDLKQHICRVDIRIKFKSIIETIIVTLEVTA